MPIVITSEKFSVYYYIKKHGKIDVNNYNAVMDEAWKIWGTRLTREDVHYIKNNFSRLEKDFKEEVKQ